MKEQFIFVTLLIVFSTMTHPARRAGRRTSLIPSRKSRRLRRQPIQA